MCVCLTHHSPSGGVPLSPPHHPEGAGAQLLPQHQLTVLDQRGQGAASTHSRVGDRRTLDAPLLATVRGPATEHLEAGDKGATVRTQGRQGGHKR